MFNKIKGFFKEYINSTKPVIIQSLRGYDEPQQVFNLDINKLHEDGFVWNKQMGWWEKK